MQFKHISTRKALPIISGLLGLLFLLQTLAVFASSASTFSQTISDGTLSVDIVDGDGAAVGSPAVTFGGLTFSFSSQNGTGTLGSATEKIRVYNPTSTETWTVSIAATTGATATWSDGGSNTYDFNDTGADGSDDADADSVGGKLTVDASGGTLAAVAPCASVANLSKGSPAAFKQLAVAVTSITLLNAGAGAATYCRWDLTDVALTQVLPAAQESGVYTLSFTITIA